MTTDARETVDVLREAKAEFERAQRVAVLARAEVETLARRAADLERALRDLLALRPWNYHSADWDAAIDRAVVLTGAEHLR